MDAECRYLLDVECTYGPDVEWTDIESKKPDAVCHFP